MNKKKIFLVITNGLIVLFSGILIKQQISKYKLMQHFKDRNIKDQLNQTRTINSNIIKFKNYWFSGISMPTKSFLVDLQGQKLLLIEERQKQYSNGRIQQNIKKKYVNSYQLYDKKLFSDKICTVDNNFEFTYCPSLLGEILLKEPSTRNRNQGSFLNTFLNIIGELGSVKLLTYQGIKFGQEQIVVGSFIYNPIARVLRCYKPKYIGPIAGLDWYTFEKKLVIAIKILTFSISLLYFLKLLINALQEPESSSIDNRLKKLQAYKWDKQKSYKCYQCNTNYHNVIFLPCFHLLACQECANDMQFCPACKKEIKDKVKIFFG